ncbi:MAG: DUF962 domain-containing protein [Nevskiales bacterium]|nr:DUF962 domain-containing protein [Nevskiales bacterium]
MTAETRDSATPGDFKTFAEFYPYYLQEHSDRTCRRLHFVGSSLALLIIAYAVFSQQWWLCLVALVQGYAFAWVGHFFFEHNRPATFKYPWLSFKGDWKMWWQMLTGRIAL